MFYLFFAILDVIGISAFAELLDISSHICTRCDAYAA